MLSSTSISHKCAKACISIILLILPISIALAGCSNASSEEASVPGAYSVDPRNVSTDGSEASDMALVVAPCMGQAFRVPEGALALAKSAIDHEGYASIVLADDLSVMGKEFKLAKNSQTGREEEAAENEAEYFRLACGARATTEGVRLYEAIKQAASDLKANGKSDNKVLVVVSSGVTNGLIEISQDLLAMSPDDVAQELHRIGALAEGEFSGLKVVFFGLGQGTGEQVIPPSAGAKIEKLMTKIIEFGGGTAEVSGVTMRALGCDSELPAVEPVEFKADRISIPEISKGETARVELTESVLQFKGDSAEYLDATKAEQTLSEVASKIAESEIESVDITGHTADTGKGDGIELSKARAQAVMNSLVAFGVDASKIGAVEGVGCVESTSYENGVFSEARAKEERRVVLTLHA